MLFIIWKYFSYRFTQKQFCFVKIHYIVFISMFWIRVVDRSKSAIGLNTPLYREPSPLYGETYIYIFFLNPNFWQHFFEKISPVKCGINRKINFCLKTISSCLEDYETIINAIVQAAFEIWFEIVTVAGIKRCEKKIEHWKWNTCWVKCVIATKSIHCQRKAVLTSHSIDAPIWITPNFCKKILRPSPFLIYQKSQLSLQKRWIYTM